MNVSEYYEYKKENDEQKNQAKAEAESQIKEERKEKNEKDKERLKNAVEKTTTVITNIPHYAKLTGAAALLGLLGKGVDKVKEVLK